MKKELREKIYQKYSGHCAYCGKEIAYKDMQVDHYFPQQLKHLPDGDINSFENLMPSCAKCNNHKGGMQISEWRGELSLQVERLRKNAQFDRALRFNQIQTTESNIYFYFETYKWYWRDYEILRHTRM